MSVAPDIFAPVGARRPATHRGGLPQRYVLDEPGRHLILARYDGRTGTIDELAERLRVPRWQVRKWGAQLGLARQKEPPWSADEIAYLEAHLSRTSVKRIASRLGRSATAVRLKAKRLGVRKSGEGYTMRALCEGLGCDHHKVARWIELGWLKGKRRQTERSAIQGGDMWYFSDRAIRRLVSAHPIEIDPRRVDWVWLVDVLTSSSGDSGDAV